MSRALSEEEEQYIQRFDTPTIRDFDFPAESGDRVMPYQTEPAATPDAGLIVTAGEPAAEQPTATIPGKSAEPEERSGGNAPSAAPEQLLDPAIIPKFVNQLPKPPVYCPVNRGDDEYLYVIDISRFTQQILPEGFPETTVWGYGGNVMDEETHQFRYDRSTPGATFEAVRNMPVRIKWINKLSGPHLMAADPARHGEDTAEGQGAVPVVTHLHGGRLSAALNGPSNAWSTCDGRAGPAYRTSVYTYPNSQDAAALWYHDNARGISQANIYAGLAGFYLLRSGAEFRWQREAILPRGRYEIPMIIQDRSFHKDGSLSFARDGIKQTIQGNRDTGFLGNTITVNGKVWPNLNVERRLYRFRLLNGSGVRVYTLRLSNGMAITQIGTDAGFQTQPRTVDFIRLAPAERADILVDFSGIEPGTKMILTNDARSPFANNDASDPETTGQIMQFTVPIDAPNPVMPKKLPKKLNA